MRRNISGSFKFKVALEAMKEQKTLRELCQQFSVQSSQIQQWKKVIQSKGASLFNKGKEEKNNDELISELYRQIGELRVENEFLKKKF